MTHQLPSDDEQKEVVQRFIPILNKNLPPNTTRELFVKYEGSSYWACEWIPELQLEVHQSSLWRCYMRKIGDARQPPSSVAAESINEVDEDDIQRRYYNPKLEQRYYKNGIRPEWLCVHRILNHRKERNGPMY